MAKKKKKKRSVSRKHDWATAKSLCRLNAVEIQMAKELGMTAKSLTKNVPSSGQAWKAPVRDWVRDLYAKKRVRQRPGKLPSNSVSKNRDPTS